MSLEDFANYWLAVPVLEAQEGLMGMAMADWPNLKNQDRSKRHRKMHSIAYPKAWSDVKETSGEDMAKIIKGLIGG